MMETNGARPALRQQQDTMVSTETLAREGTTGTFLTPFTDAGGAGVGPQLTPQQLAAFRRDGFLRVDDLTSRDEITSLGGAGGRRGAGGRGGGGGARGGGGTRD